MKRMTSAAGLAVLLFALTHARGSTIPTVSEAQSSIGSNRLETCANPPKPEPRPECEPCCTDEEKAQQATVTSGNGGWTIPGAGTRALSRIENDRLSYTHEAL
ncbi:MAG: hypothetical protein QME60_09080, partial [Verrucomicrobiota bacterium]|nr:hypothetical protein [Verrucomicrobiota bacterium]